MPNRLRLFLVLFAAVLVLAGCSQNLGPKNYNDEVKTNYQENCLKGATDKLGAAGATNYCECTYNGFVGKITFDNFKKFESYVREHTGDDLNNATDLKNKYPDIVQLLDGCVVQGPTPAGVSTTIPTTTTSR